jgi:RILP-like protein 1
LHHQELEQIEEHWRSESRELVALVGRLQEENRRLAGQLEPMNSPSADMEASFVGRLRDDADVLREENRSKERELQHTKRETDQVDFLVAAG